MTLMALRVAQQARQRSRGLVAKPTGKAAAALEQSSLLRVCRMAAEQARQSAEVADFRQRKPYLKVAGQWDKLADHIEQELREAKAR